MAHPLPSVVEVGGVPVTPFRGVSDAAESLLSAAGGGRGGFALAINAEKIVRIRSEPEWSRIVRATTTCYADGAPIAWTLRRRGAPDAVRVPGVELWEEIMKLAALRDLPVYLLGGKPDVLEGVRTRLTQELGVTLVGSQHGYFDDPREVLDAIEASQPQIVTVAMGTPGQEEFILQARERHPGALYMGVGGTYDVFVGRVPRAPAWFREQGLEWLYRLMKTPTRFRRQLNLVRYALLHVRGEI